MSLPCLCLLLVALLVGGPLRTQQARTPSWQEIGRVACDDGSFTQQAFGGDPIRLLTAGEKGDLILWDHSTGRELRRYPPLDDNRVASLRMHPRDGWAIVVTGWREQSRTHVLLLGSGRHWELWQRWVEDVAFNQDGTRMAVLFTDGNRSQLYVHRAEAVLAGRFEYPLSTRSIDAWGRLLFDPDGAVVLSGSRSLRIGADHVDELPRIVAFQPNGTPEYASDHMRRPEQVCGAWSATSIQGRVNRAGPVACHWDLPPNRSWYGDPIVAADGTVAIPDGLGRLFLFGPAPGRRQELRGHLGDPLQMVFAADASALAVATRHSVRFLRCEDGAVRRLDQACGVQAGTPKGFLLLGEHSLSVADAAVADPPVFAWQSPGEATTLHWNWTGMVDPVPWLWVPPAVRNHRKQPGRLWLGEVTRDDNEWNNAAVILDGRRAPVRLDRSVERRDVFDHMRVSAIAAVRSGNVLLAETTGPLQCGTGLQDVKHWGALRLFDGAGTSLRQRFLERGISRMRTSPGGKWAVLFPGAIVVDTDTLRTVGTPRVGGTWIDFAFVDGQIGIATDGVRLFRVHLPSLSVKVLPPVPGSCRIDALVTAQGGRLLAVASRGEVVVYRQPRPW